MSKNKKYCIPYYHTTPGHHTYVHLISRSSPSPISPPNRKLITLFYATQYHHQALAHLLSFQVSRYSMLPCSFTLTRSLFAGRRPSLSESPLLAAVGHPLLTAFPSPLNSSTTEYPTTTSCSTTTYSTSTTTTYSTSK